MNPGPTATKKNVLEQLLEQGMVLVALDARVDGVDVPTHLGKDPQLRLNLSYRFGLPMDVDEWGVSATLTFAGIPYSCRFPWNAIFLLVSHVSGQPYLFPDDIPAELLTQAPEMAAAARQQQQLQQPPAKAPARPKLTLVTPGTDAPAAEAPVELTEPADTPKAPNPAKPAPTAADSTLDSGAPIPKEPDEPSPRPRRKKGRGHLRLVK